MTSVPARAEEVPVTAAPAVVSEETLSLQDIEILGDRIERNPEGRTITRVQREEITKTDTFSLKDLLESSPGVHIKQSNGPRDVGISLRGSNAKQGFGVRNMKIYEDWFPTTQSDGLSRTDLHDPNAYDGIDVIRGPSSSLHDNYAVGGVLNFRSRQGRDIRGVEVGSSGGSHGYLNNYVDVGNHTDGFEYALFGSVIKGNGHINHSDFLTATQNFTLAFTPDPLRTFYFKFLNNDLDADVPSRLSRNQFRQDPRSAGTTFVTGVGTVPAERADQNRHDRRTIIGGRYHYTPTPATGYRVMLAYDVKDINQTFGQISDNINPNFHHYADVTHEGSWLGRPAKHYAGFFYNYMEQESNTYANLADFKGTRGRVEAESRGWHRNIGARLREEWAVASKLNAVLGVGVENSAVNANIQTRVSSETFRYVSVDRVFFNAAPELALVYQHAPEMKFHARVGTAYGIPGIGQLTTTPSGTAGNNIDLKPQRVVGFELGSEGKVGRHLALNIAGYYELFYNELVTQSPAAGLSNFTSNAPRADHRGVEVWLNWRPVRGFFWSGAYTLNDHVYKDFRETLSGTVFDRSEKKVPGVEPQIINSKIGYDQPAGFGGWMEVSHVDDFFVNNSNTLKTEPYTIYNLNLHYSRDWPERRVFKGMSVFFDVKNLFDKTYIGSANVVADTAADTPQSLLDKQAFFAGPDRSFFGGVKLKF
jgi:iron complex outermembrane receptor protein